MVGMVHDCGIWYYDHVIANMNYNITHPLVKKVFGGHYNHQCHPNAGVMLVNLTLYKEKKILAQVEELIKLNNKEFIYKLGKTCTIYSAVYITIYDVSTIRYSWLHLYLYK